MRSSASRGGALLGIGASSVRTHPQQCRMESTEAQFYTVQFAISAEVLGYRNDHLCGPSSRHLVDGEVEVTVTANAA